MRDWELVLYKYANVSLLESECPDSPGPHRQMPFPVRVRYRRAIPPFVVFFSFSLSLSRFIFRYSTRHASIFRFITSLYKIVLFLSILQ